MRNLIQVSTVRLRTSGYLASVAMASLLSACGGGEDALAVRDSANAVTTETASERLVVDEKAGTVKFSYNTIGGGVLTSAFPLADQDKKFISVSEAEAATLTKQSTGREQAQAVNPSPCNTYRFSGTQGCLQPGSDVFEYVGSSTADIVGVIPNCTEVTVGSAFSAITPAPGARACFQYTVEASTTFTNQVILPATISAATVELFAVIPNTLAFKKALSQSPTNPHNLTATHAYARYVLMVRAADGAGGQPFNVGIGVPAGPLATALNDDPTRPSLAPMNETKTATINTTGQGDFYYFYPTTPGQTTAQFLSTFTANQTVAWRKASRSAAGVYTLVTTETVLPATASGNTQVISGLTATAAGAATTNGVMVRVSKKAPFAGVAQNFSTRVGVKTGYLTDYELWNFEGLNNIYDLAMGLKQAHNYIGVTLYVKDANGQPVKGEALTVTVYQDEWDLPSAPVIEGTTDACRQVHDQRELARMPVWCVLPGELCSIESWRPLEDAGYGRQG
ncbi:hypothetical protein [Pseudorhodoferax soli]|uniref:Uncharacterized protein n=1 Tax=Pseudorhodoferax soli TaxID=545864 RepID=A0A368XAY9_9BURK|nr:hypothetical protein [Pseudorhodoferax soli]RCW65120.1 hypothetical protein DES41_11344 [Pseudorhodoferax soli]